MAISHKFTLICDDVRQENNGKMIYIGGYNDAIFVPQIPFLMPTLSFVLFLTTDIQTNMTMRFRVQLLETGRDIVGGMAGGILQPGLTLVFPIRFGPFQIQAVGAYNFIVEIEGMREQIITPFSVILQVPQQPGPQQQLQR